MFPNPYLNSVDPLREFRKLSKFEQRRIVWEGIKKRPKIESIREIIKLIESK